MIARSNIKVGSSRIVGEISLDAGDIRGAGGVDRPQLTIPLRITMTPRPAAQMLALVDLKISLHLVDPPSPANQVGATAHLDLRNGFHARSLPGGVNDYTTPATIDLTAHDIERLETLRHAGPPEAFRLTAQLQGHLVWMRAAHNEIGGSNPAQFDPTEGMYVDVVPMWQTTLDTVTFHLEQSAWVRNVLPKLGYDRRRLIEVRLPPPTATAQADASFAAALRHLDASSYAAAVASCRAVLNSWRRTLGATNSQPPATRIADRLGWTPDDPRRAMLDGLWKSIYDYASSEHHPETHPTSYAAEAAEARAIVLLTATLSEYVATLAELPTPVSVAT